jgi:hypothetical protein
VTGTNESSGNPEFAAYGRSRLKWIENEPGALRDANDFLAHHGYGSLKDTTGYYCDNFQDSTAVPALYVQEEDCAQCDGSGTCHDTERGDDNCPECDGDGKKRNYFAAVRDPCNEGCAIVDFGAATDDATEAARDAHALAERYAEDCREDDAKFQCEQQIEQACDDIRMARRKHSALIREWLAADVGEFVLVDNALSDACAALRRQVSKAHKRIKLLRNEPWLAVPP